MVRDPEGRKFRYVVSATIRTGTMERELNEVPPEFSFVGMTAFLAEGAAILEAEVPAGSGPDTVSRFPGGPGEVRLRKALAERR